MHRRPAKATPRFLTFVVACACSARLHRQDADATKHMEKFDVVIIGSGPGGYIAAIRSGQLGLKTALVEKDKELGGTCLNVGCIPSKALLTSSDHYMFVKKEAAKHGIVIDCAHADLAKMQQRKDNVAKTFNTGVRT